MQTNQESGSAHARMRYTASAAASSRPLQSVNTMLRWCSPRAIISGRRLNAPRELQGAEGMWWTHLLVWC